MSSLLARKTPKQCKARWTEWLDPGIRKIEWSKEEDEKLLHLAKLMPTQWRTIAPIVGRTATQCLERYQKLLDEAEAKENDELGLGGPTGGETAAPSADDVRRLRYVLFLAQSFDCRGLCVHRPGELDPDPESKPARPDTIDLDEDEKEMLSEARARLANTQGKKAKRKARERQLEESRRLALLQKRRELKNAGINIKITNRKKGQMDYNADIPFEHKPAAGFYDTTEELDKNERQREAFDPRKQQLANKRKGDQDNEMEAKRRKEDKPGNAPSAAFAAAAKAGQMQRIREAEQSTKRKALNLPAPQVSESELEDIVKMGLVGEQANHMAGDGENGATRGLVGNYSGIIGSTPIRTPRAPAQEDHIANEIRNIRALTETQSSLLGGENTPLHEGSSSTGFDGIAPRKHVVSTPNPMATPLRNGGPGGVAATPSRSGAGPGATPMRTPRDNFAINANENGSQMVGSTPREIRMREKAAQSQIQSQFASLPRPKELDFELNVPEEQDETNGDVEMSEEDAAERDRRNQALREAAERAELRRRTRVMQRNLPRPSQVDADVLFKSATRLSDPVEMMIAKETALLVMNDATKYPTSDTKMTGTARPLEIFDDDALRQASLEIILELPPDQKAKREQDFEIAYSECHASEVPGLPGLSGYETDSAADEDNLITAATQKAQQTILKDAEEGTKIEKKLALHYGGYQQRSKMLRQKIVEAADALEEERRKLNTFRDMQIAEEAALPRRLEALRQEVEFAKKRERDLQELYRQKKEEQMAVNGFHVNGAGVNGGS